MKLYQTHFARIKSLIDQQTFEKEDLTDQLTIINNQIELLKDILKCCQDNPQIINQVLE